MAIVYFDGHCNLCNRFVDFLIRRDHRRVLKFAPLQGRTAAERLPEPLRVKLSSVVFQSDDGVLAVESAAAIRTLAALGGGWTLMRVFLAVPALARDAIYRLIARNRYHWFGRRDTCRLPTVEERSQFLD